MVGGAAAVEFGAVEEDGGGEEEAGAGAGEGVIEGGGKGRSLSWKFWDIGIRVILASGTLFHFQGVFDREISYHSILLEKEVIGH